MVVATDVEGDVARIAFDRPEKRNAITIELVNELDAVLERAETECDVAVLTGTGSAFCAGADYTETPISADQSRTELKNRLRTVQNTIQRIRNLSIPVIGRINGPAVGAGCGFAFATDFRIAAESAMFHENFVELGVVSGDGGAYMLPRLVGEATAKEIIMLGRPIPGDEAEELGIVTETVPDDDLNATVEEYVEKLHSFSSTALAKNKELINGSTNVTYEQSMEAAVNGMWTCMQADEFEEAGESFLQ